MFKRISAILIFYFVFSSISNAEELKGQACSPEKSCPDCHEYYPGLKFEPAYRNGKIDGLQKMYYRDGKLAEEITYKNGKIDGLVKIFYSDGTLWEEQVYKEGLLLDENNKPKNGVYKRFYKNGKLAKQVEYNQGLPYGESKSFYENGNIKVLEIFISQDNRIFKTYNEQGKPIKDGKIVGRFYTGYHWVYNDEVEPEWAYSFEKNVPSGVSKHFGKDGKVDWEYLFNNGQATYAKAFYETGRLKIKGNFDGIVWNGKYEEFYENGQLKYETFFRDGKRNGKNIGYYMKELD